jgi:hypothetical protein
MGFNLVFEGLIQHPWDKTGAGLSNVPDYQTVPILT